MSMPPRLALVTLLGSLGLASPALAGERYFTETFSDGSISSNLADLQSAYAVVDYGGTLGTWAHKDPSTAACKYLATAETDYNDGDWTFTVDWNLGYWDYPMVGLGEASPSGVNWVVGMPDNSIYITATTHQPWGDPGKIQLWVQRNGNDATFTTIGSFVGGLGVYSFEVTKVGNTVSFAMYNTSGALMGSGAISDITTTAPWLTSSNSRLFVGSRDYAGGASGDSWDNFTVAGALDTDGDGITDDLDLCPADPDNTDVDADLICDSEDECLGDNAFPDEDGDQICEDIDACYGSDALGDEDGDGFCQDLDNCPVDANADQADADSDAIGDACEADGDQDGVIDDDDNCVDDVNIDQADGDADEVGDVCDDDDDNDGVTDGADNCPVVANASQANFDGDGTGDACDGDDDADAVGDDADLCTSTPLSSLVNESGCSGEQYVSLTCGTESSWSNHGEYVSCIAHATTAARTAGLITGKQGGVIVSTAAKSSTGKK